MDNEKFADPTNEKPSDKQPHIGKEGDNIYIKHHSVILKAIKPFKIIDQSVLPLCLKKEIFALMQGIPQQANMLQRCAMVVWFMMKPLILM